MSWPSWSAFWDMGGYGLYVWGSYSVCAAIFVVELAMIRRHHRLAVMNVQTTA
jgi:heme exporter protein D